MFKKRIFIFCILMGVVIYPEQNRASGKPPGNMVFGEPRFSLLDDSQEEDEEMFAVEQGDEYQGVHGEEDFLTHCQSGNEDCVNKEEDYDDIKDVEKFLWYYDDSKKKNQYEGSFKNDPSKEESVRASDVTNALGCKEKREKKIREKRKNKSERSHAICEKGPGEKDQDFDEIKKNSSDLIEFLFGSGPMKDDFIGGLTLEDLKLFRTKHVKQFTSENIIHLKHEPLCMLLTYELPEVSDEVIGALSIEKLQGISHNYIKRIRKKYWEKFAPEVKVFLQNEKNLRKKAKIRETFKAYRLDERNAEKIKQYRKDHYLCHVEKVKKWCENRCYHKNRCPDKNICCQKRKAKAEAKKARDEDKKVKSQLQEEEKMMQSKRLCHADEEEKE